MTPAGPFEPTAQARDVQAAAQARAARCALSQRTTMSETHLASPPTAQSRPFFHRSSNAMRNHPKAHLNGRNRTATETASLCSRRGTKSWPAPCWTMRGWKGSRAALSWKPLCELLASRWLPVPPGLIGPSRPDLRAEAPRA